MKTSKKSYLIRSLFLICMIVATTIITGFQSEAKDIRSWKELSDSISAQKPADGLVEYKIKSECNKADKLIDIKGGIKVKIVGESQITIKRDDKLTTSFFNITGEDTQVEISNLILDGNNKDADKACIVVGANAKFVLGKTMTIQNCKSKDNGGAIYNDANTVIHNNTKMDKCTSAKNGNAIYNSPNGKLTVYGCNITGAGNNNPDIYQEGTLEFVANKAENKTTVNLDNIEKGIYIANPESTFFNSYFSQIEVKKIPLSISDNIKTNDYIIKAKLEEWQINQLMNILEAKAGFGKSVTFAINDGIVRTKVVSSCAFDTDTIVVIGVGETAQIKGIINEPDAYITSAMFETDSSSIALKQTSNTSCEVTGKKYTGINGKYNNTLKYRVDDNDRFYRFLSDSINIVVEEMPTISANACKVGKPAVITANEYSNDYAEVDYRWMVSKDNGKTWERVKDGTGDHSMTYTTPAVTDESLNWQYKCEVKIKVDGGCKKPRALVSNVILLKDAGKKDPALALKNTTATYNGSAISVTATAADATVAKAVVCTYYTNKEYTAKTTAADGAKEVGGAPVNAGTYYVVASVKETQAYKSATIKGTLKIAKAKGEFAVKANPIKIAKKKSVNVAITKNFGNVDYTVQSSNAKIATVSKGKGVIACKGLGTGECTLTVKTAGNNNIEPCTVNVTILVAPGQIKLKSAKSLAKKQLQIKWKVDKSVTGYDLQYAKDSKFKKGAKIVTTTKNKKGKGTCKGLKSKSVYYVRMRGIYIAKDGTKVVGPWSKKKKAKIK